VEHY